MTKKRNEKTSPEVATDAAKILRDSNASDAEKRVAGSALTQADDTTNTKKNGPAKDERARKR